MAEIYKLKFEDMAPGSASPAENVPRDTEAKINSFNAKERLAKMSRRGAFALGAWN